MVIPVALPLFSEFSVLVIKLVDFGVVVVTDSVGSFGGIVGGIGNVGSVGSCLGSRGRQVVVVSGSRLW